MTARDNNRRKNLLQTTVLTMQFGWLTELDSVDLSINEGQIIGLIGSNGAGKTTFFNLLTGISPPPHFRKV